MRVLKSRIFAFIIGAIIFSGITAVIATSVTADDISYGNGTVKDALDNLYDIEGTQVATLTTQGATYTMQHDGYITGTIRTGNGAAGAIYFNQSNHDSLDGTVAIAPSNYNNNVTVSVFAPKNTVVSTRTDWGTYNLTVYEWK